MPVKTEAEIHADLGDAVERMRRVHHANSTARKVEGASEPDVQPRQIKVVAPPASPLSKTNR
jgi:hypothetical protein